MSPELAGRFFTISTTWEGNQPFFYCQFIFIFKIEITLGCKIMKAYVHVRLYTCTCTYYFYFCAHYQKFSFICHRSVDPLFRLHATFFSTPSPLVTTTLFFVSMCLVCSFILLFISCCFFFFLHEWNCAAFVFFHLTYFQMIILNLKLEFSWVGNFHQKKNNVHLDGECSHEIKRCLLLGRKVMTNPDSILRSRDITLSAKVRLVRLWFFQ